MKTIQSSAQYGEQNHRTIVAINEHETYYLQMTNWFVFLFTCDASIQGGRGRLVLDDVYHSEFGQFYSKHINSIYK